MPASRVLQISSIPGLAILALALATLPLIIALVTSTVYLNTLNRQGQQSIHQATIVANASQQLFDSLIAMERSARQYNILLDKELFNVYLDNRKDFNQSLAMLKGLPVSNQMVDTLEEITQEEEKIHQGLQTVLLGTEQASQLLTGFFAINKQARVIRNQSSKLKSAAVDNLQQSAQRAKSLMLWQLAGLVPIMVFVIYMFMVLILKPIRQLDRAIRKLGRGELESPIRVKGPKDLEELGDSLDWMRQRIIELENQKNQFLQHMSHELKTPLTSLREGSELLSEEVIGELNDSQKDVAQLLRHNCQRLQEQIENLLTYSVAQSHQMKLDITDFMLDALIEETLIDHKLAMKYKNLVLTTQLDGILISADREKLRMVIDNLLSNAVKYSPIGGQLQISTSNQQGQISLEVLDEGPGIPKQEQEKVFEAFFQGAISPKSAIKGTGIGLSVCQAYVKAHGGQIFVKPSSKGACLCVMLPQKH